MQQVKKKNVSIGTGIPKICVPITGQSEGDILRAAEKIVESETADLIEWRVDFFEQVSDWSAVKTVLEKLQPLIKKHPLIFTFRSYEEGGAKPFSTFDYFQLYERVLTTSYIDLLDIELFKPINERQRLIAQAQERGVAVILCNHDFAGTPAKQELLIRLQDMQAAGADICKIAVMPQNAQDVLALLSATEEMHRCFAAVPLITMAMGSFGLISRVTGELFGSAITFGTVDHASAPGQIDSQQLKELLELFQG